MANKETESILQIKQGDQYHVPVFLSFNGERFTTEDLYLLDTLEYAFDGLEPICVSAKDSWYEEGQCFLLPLKQEQTMKLEDGRTVLDFRVKFVSGDIVGVKKMFKTKIVDAISEELI